MSVSRKRRERPAGVAPDMNVTPLVDVVLVLLIIFMVVAPQMDKNVPVELPGIFNPDPQAKVSDPFKLTIDRSGSIFVDQTPMSLDDAIATLSAWHAEEPLRRLVLRADKEITYGQVRQVLARTQQVGFPGLSLMVGEKAKETRPGSPASASGDGQPATAAADVGSREG